MNQFLSGAIVMGSLCVSVFFLKFWKKTNDRFFIYFSVGFLLLALEKIVFMVVALTDEEKPFVYLIRSSAYLVFIGAILQKNIDKNRNRSKAP